MSTQPSKALRWVLLLVFILVPLVNYLSFLFPGGGERRFEDDANTLIDAADYAFSIWGLIFLGMIIFSIYLLRHEQNGTPALQRAIIYLIVAGIASILFVPISISGNQVLGWVDILAHLIPLILANRALRAHVAADPAYGHWSYFAPSMYMGWISAATVISTALMLQQLGVSLQTDIALIVANILVIVLLDIALRLLRREDAVYAITVAWALIAVGVAQSDYTVTKTVAWLSAAIIIGYIVFRAVKGRSLFYAVRR